MERTAGKQSTTGSRLLLVGGVLAVAGIVLIALGGSPLFFAGVVLAAIATPITIGGLALTLTGLVGSRAAKHKDFA